MNYCNEDIHNEVLNVYDFYDYEFCGERIREYVGGSNDNFY